jgi:hypothetical protein
MLLVLIPTAWLAIIAFVVILCRAAARGDAALASATLASKQRYEVHKSAQSHPQREKRSIVLG